MDLILHTFGTSLSRDNAGFVIHTKNDEVKRLSTEGIDSIHISRGVQITSDAILLALEKGIEILLIDKTGKPAGRFWSAKYGSVSTIRKGQLIFTMSAEAVNWIKNIINRKILNQQALLLTLRTSDSHQQHYIDKAVSRLEELSLKTKTLEGQLVRDVAPQLRGWEGYASKIYFETISRFLPEQYRFDNRSQHPAMDVANALFNYAYGILYGKIEGILISVGIDPYIGVMHRDEYNRPVLVYDFIEPYRIWADYTVISILSQEFITDEYYSIQPDGSVFLETLGRRVLIQSMNDYLDEVIVLRGLNRSRIYHLQMEAQELAQKFKRMSSRF